MLFFMDPTRSTLGFATLCFLLCSETYDTEGRFVPEKFEEVFSKYGKTHKNALTLREVNQAVRGNANIMDPVR